MTSNRIIPCLDIDNGRVVKGKKFLDLQDIADPVEFAKKYDQAGADELIFYDITATTNQRETLFDLAKQVSEVISIPLTIGGGIHSMDTIQKAFDAGAAKVSINSAAVKNPKLLQEAAATFGSERIILSMDVQKTTSGQWQVFLQGGQKNTGIDSIDWAVRGEQLGAGELVVNAISEDGVKNGYQIELTRAIAEAVSIPVIASGGAGKPEHFVHVLQEGKADAALAASVFHYDDIQIPALKQYLAESLSIGRNNA